MSVFRFLVYSRMIFVVTAFVDIYLFCSNHVTAAILLLCALLASLYFLFRCPNCGYVIDLRGSASAFHFCPRCGYDFNENSYRLYWSDRQH